jgi:hypothetical protein
MSRQENEEKEVLEEIIETIRDNPEINTIDVGRDGKSFVLQFGEGVAVAALVMYVFKLEELIQERKARERREVEVEDFWEQLSSYQRQLIKDKLGIKN